MSTPGHFVVFRMDRQRYALPLLLVERVMRAVAVTTLPRAPGLVMGAVDVHGRILPVLDVRQRFLLPRRDIRAVDWFVIARTTARTVVLVVDDVEGVIERPDAEIIPVPSVATGVDGFPGIIRLPDGLALIHDLDRFLSADDAAALNKRIDERQT